MKKYASIRREIQVYKILAKEDDDMKKLLQEYNELEELSF